MIEKKRDFDQRISKRQHEILEEDRKKMWDSRQRILLQEIATYFQMISREKMQNQPKDGDLDTKNQLQNQKIESPYDDWQS